MATESEISDIEIDLLLDGIRRAHGYDFSGYADASLRRRLNFWLSTSGFSSFGAALPTLLRDAAACAQMVHTLTVNVTEMFRDPGFFKALRERVVPHLRTYPHARIWVAGCASGEEVYSLAIVLHEEGLLANCHIYATDLNQAVLAEAKQRVLPLNAMQNFTRNYQLAGGKAAFSDYYAARYERAIIDPSLVRNVIFAPHNLATDSDFNEMQVILCRNVLIYFKPTLKERVLGMFDNCLSPGGFLCLGTKETLDGRRIAANYVEEEGRMRIYRKRYRQTTPEGER